MLSTLRLSSCCNKKGKAISALSNPWITIGIHSAGGFGWGRHRDSMISLQSAILLLLPDAPMYTLVDPTSPGRVNVIAKLHMPLIRFLSSSAPVSQACLPCRKPQWEPVFLFNTQILQQHNPWLSTYFIPFRPVEDAWLPQLRGGDSVQSSMKLPFQPPMDHQTCSGHTEREKRAVKTDNKRQGAVELVCYTSAPWCIRAPRLKWTKQNPCKKIVPSLLVQSTKAGISMPMLPDRQRATLSVSS